MVDGGASSPPAKRSPISNHHLAINGKLSREREDRRIAMEARALLGNALRKLQAALDDRTLVYRDETLAACQACTVYEVHRIYSTDAELHQILLTRLQVIEPQGDSLSGWLAHINGVARLVQLRGTRLHRSPAAHQIFLGYRVTAVSFSYLPHSNHPIISFNIGPCCPSKPQKNSPGRIRMEDRPLGGHTKND